MKINRHNYETFFLLYADNELSAAERKVVEEFVLVNSDLAPELESIIDTILPADTVKYPSTENLYKKEIELDSLQENLLLHLDNELDTAAKKDIESVINTDKNIQKEWELWKKTKLDENEQVTFQDKKSLYRYERRGVVSMRFYRIAAAAVLLIGLFTAISVLTRNEPADNTIAKSKIIESKNNKPVITSEVNPAETASHISENTPAGNVSEDKASLLAEKKNNTASVAIKNNSQPVKENNIAALQQEKNKVSDLENINNNNSNEQVSPNVLNNKRAVVVYQNQAPGDLAASSVKEKVSAPARPLIDYNSELSTNDNYAKTAALNDGETESGNKIFYMNEETVNRSKVGGLLRKVKRVIERNTNINTSNGVKVAGFEFAVK